jgi:hypothetical protein
LPTNPPLNASLPKILFENCVGAALGIEVPADTVVDDVPDAFGPASTIPFSAYLGMTGFECPRIVAFNQTYQNIAFLWTYIGAIPKEKSWEENGLSYYVWDVIVTNQTFGDKLRALGIPAASGSLKKDLVPVGGSTQETWEFSNSKASFRLTFHQDVQPGPVYQRLWHNWAGSNPFLRFDVDRKDTLSQTFQNDAGRIELAGESGYHKAAGVDQAAAYGGSIVSLNWEVEAVPKVFKK